MREIHLTQGSTPLAQQALGPGAFGLILLSIGLSFDWVWEQTIRPNLAAHALIWHQPFIDWPSMVCYVLIAVGMVGSGLFFLDYYRAYDYPKSQRIFVETALLAILVTSLSLVDWVLFGLYGQIAAYTDTYSILYPAVAAGDILAPWLLGVLLLLWGRSLIQFSHELTGKSPPSHVLAIAGRLFLTAGVLSVLIPALNIVIAVSLIGEDIFSLYGLFMLNEVILAPLKLGLIWAAAISAIVPWRSRNLLGH